MMVEGEEGDSGVRHDQDLEIFMNPAVFFLGPAGGGGGEEGDSRGRHDQSGKLFLRPHVGYACCPGPGGRLSRQDSN